MNYAKLMFSMHWKLKATAINSLSPMYWRQTEVLTIIVNSEGHIGSDDVIEADLAVLRGAVGIQSLHAHDSIK